MRQNHHVPLTHRLARFLLNLSTRYHNHIVFKQLKADLRKSNRPLPLPPLRKGGA